MVVVGRGTGERGRERCGERGRERISDFRGGGDAGEGREGARRREEGREKCHV